MAIAAAMVVGAAAPSAASAQAVVASPASQEVAAIQFDVPAGPLADSLVVIAKTSGEAISIDQALVADKRSRAIRGAYTPAQAFELALAGSNLHIDRAAGGLVVAPGATVDTTGAEGRVLSTVRVSSVDGGTAGGYVSTGGSIIMPSQGANGSYDTLATEGTDSYAPIGTQLATGAPASIHDTPFSVSAVTQQRIVDSRLETLNDAFDALPGIIVNPTNGSGSKATIYSRGYAITNFQVDGNAPFITSQSNASGYYPQFDLSEFDSVSVIRGGDAISSGFGDPGGTVNLQRKRPVAGTQLVTDLTAGSWQKYRGSVDFSTPLVADGLIKVRTVLTHDQQHFFFDRAHLSRDLAYVNFEIAPDAKTSINFGGALRHEYGLDWNGGLPLNIDGTLTSLPRSTCLCFDGDHSSRRTAEMFLEGRHEFSKVWRVRANLDYQIYKNDFNYSYTYAPAGLFPEGSRTGVGYAPVSINGSSGSSLSRALTGGAELDGGFKIFGRLQTFTIGYAANQQKIDRTNGANYTVNAYTNPIDPAQRFNLLSFDPTADEGSRTYTYDNSFKLGRSRQNSFYAQLRLNPLAGVWVTVSGRHEVYRNTYVSTYFTGDNRVSKWQKPAVTAKYDITKNLNIYGSLSFIDQSVISTYLDANLKELTPARGTNMEAGVKYQSGNGRLNASAVWFQTQKRNLALYDSVTARQLHYPSHCCYVGGYNYDNDGVDFELNGALTRNWQISAGYTFMFRQQITSNGVGTGRIPPVLTRLPKHVVKLASAYTFRGGALDGTTIGGDLKYQSNAVSSTYLYTINSMADFLGTPPYIFFPSSPGTITQPAYTVVNIFARYRISPRYSVQANIGNLFDKTYYTNVSGVAMGNWYGTPRSFEVTLRAKF